MKSSSVRLRKIDIHKWRSPVARQYRISRLPHLRLYEGKQLVTANQAEVMAKLRQLAMPAAEGASESSSGE